jgi:hypothetical protein
LCLLPRLSPATHGRNERKIQEREGKRFFFEKKNQKTSAPGGVRTSVPIKPNRRLGLIGTEAQPPPGAKVFLLLFFQKKKRFLSSPVCS